MSDRHPAVAASAAGLWLTVNPDSVVATEVSARLTAHPDPEIAEIAQLSLTELANFDPPSPTEPGDIESDGTSSTILHGTWARWGGEGWWRPGGDFHSLIATEDSLDLCACPAYFRWPGGNHDGTRSRASRDLVAWARLHSDGHLTTLFAHSHGATVALDALDRGLSVDLLVLLSAPVMKGRDPAWVSSVGRAISYRSKYDLVLTLLALKDSRYGVRFTDGSVVEQDLPLLVSHSATRKAQTWRRYSLLEDLDYHRALVPTQAGTVSAC